MIFKWPARHATLRALLPAAVIVLRAPIAFTFASAGPNLQRTIYIGSSPADITISETTQRVIGTGDFNGDGADDVMLEGLVPTVPIFAPEEADILFGVKGAVSPANIKLSASKPDISVKFTPAGTRGQVLAVTAERDIQDGISEDIDLVSNAAAGPDGQSGTAIFIFRGQSLPPGDSSLAAIAPDLTVFEQSAPIPQPLAERGAGQTETSAPTQIVNLGVLAVGDINGDGVPDLMISESILSGGGAHAEIGVLLGPFSEGQVIDLGQRRPEVQMTATGGPVLPANAVIADVNGDGINDMLIGRPAAGRHGADSGEVDVMFGSKSFKPGSNLSLDQPDAVVLGALGATTTPIPGVGEQLGQYVTAGDFNDDGIQDILIGMPSQGLSDISSFGGEGFVIFGSRSLGGRVVDTGLNQQDVTIQSAGVGDGLGRFVSSGDVNGDAIDDIAIGAPSAHDTSGASAQAFGAAYVIFGSANLVSGMTINLARGQQDITVFGPGPEPGVQMRFMTTTGDFNGDEAGDILIDVQGEAILAGAGYVFFGGQAAPPVINLVKFKRSASRLLIFGSSFDGSAEVQINGQTTTGPVQFVPAAGELIVTGTKHGLNLHAGANIIVVTENGSVSNRFSFSL